MTSRLLTVADVAELLAKPPSFVYNHIADLPAIRIGRQLRFREADVQAWIEDLRVR